MINNLEGLELIRARAEAEARRLEARAMLHPAAQATYAFWEGVANLIKDERGYSVTILVIFAIGVGLVSCSL